MARIRTVKPSFFRHGELQDLEAANPGKHCMLVFAGLWGHCDRTGVFECDPRQLKLDILPFLRFDMAETLDLLCRQGFLRFYEVNGKQYAVIPSFSEHQRISGKEAQEPLKHPREVEGKHSGSTREATVNKQGSNGEASGKHLPVQEVEGNGVQEGKGNGVGRASRLPADWTPTPEQLNFCQQERPDLDAATTAAKFRDHWLAAPKGTKLDWGATWRNWVRNEKRLVGSKSVADKNREAAAEATRRIMERA